MLSRILLCELFQTVIHHGLVARENTFGTDCGVPGVFFPAEATAHYSSSFGSSALRLFGSSALRLFGLDRFIDDRRGPAEGAGQRRAWFERTRLAAHRGPPLRQRFQVVGRGPSSLTFLTRAQFAMPDRKAGGHRRFTEVAQLRRVSGHLALRASHPVAPGQGSACNCGAAAGVSHACPLRGLLNFYGPVYKSSQKSRSCAWSQVSITARLLGSTRICSMKASSCCPRSGSITVICPR
jgi:hypothetical protein